MIKIGIIGGSGLDNPKILKKQKNIAIKTPFGDPASVLTTGEIGGRKVAVLARHGKNHTIMPSRVPYRANIWALKEIGCTHILATTACGSLKEEIKPGELVFLDQFIDFTKQRNLTFFEDEVVHTPMADPFCPQLRKLLIKSASDLKIPHHKSGTMATIEGPRFSTRAESRMFQLLGADVVNMSTVPEVILAREMGICYQSIAMATDYDCWKEQEEAVTWEMVVKTMNRNAKNVIALILETVPKIKFLKCSCRG